MLSLDKRVIRILLILALTLLFTASVESVPVQRAVVEDKSVLTKKAHLPELSQVGNKEADEPPVHEPLLGDLQEKVSISGSVVHSESASLNGLADRKTGTDSVATSTAIEEKQNVLLPPKVPTGIVQDDSAVEDAIVKRKSELGFIEAATGSGQRSERLTRTESVLENSATIDEHIPNAPSRTNNFIHDASVFANEQDTTNIANTAVLEVSRDVNLTDGNFLDAEAPSGGIASQSEADEHDEQPARDPENVHAIPPPQKAKSDAETIPIVVHEPNLVPDVASEVFASYVAERSRRDRIAAAKVTGVRSIRRDDQIGASTVAREAAERGRALARDPNKTWRNGPPQHLYTGYTYRPPHSWSADVTTSPADATTVRSAKSDVYEAEETDNQLKFKTRKEPEKKAVPLGKGINEVVNDGRTENQVTSKRIKGKTGRVGFQDGSAKDHFQMTKRGGASASKALITVVGIGFIVGAFRLCLIDRRSLLLLRRFGQPKEHV